MKNVLNINLCADAAKPEPASVSDLSVLNNTLSLTFSDGTVLRAALPTYPEPAAPLAAATLRDTTLTLSDTLGAPLASVDLASLVPAAKADRFLSAVHYDAESRELVLTVAGEGAETDEVRASLDDLLPVVSSEPLTGTGTTDDPLTLRVGETLEVREGALEVREPVDPDSVVRVVPPCANVTVTDENTGKPIQLCRVAEMGDGSLRLLDDTINTYDRAMLDGLVFNVSEQVLTVLTYVTTSDAELSPSGLCMGSNGNMYAALRTNVDIHAVDPSVPLFRGHQHEYFNNYIRISPTTTLGDDNSIMLGGGNFTNALVLFKLFDDPNDCGWFGFQLSARLPKTEVRDYEVTGIDASHYTVSHSLDPYGAEYEVAEADRYAVVNPIEGDAAPLNKTAPYPAFDESGLNLYQFLDLRPPVGQPVDITITDRNWNDVGSLQLTGFVNITKPQYNQVRIMSNTWENKTWVFEDKGHYRITIEGATYNG